MGEIIMVRHGQASFGKENYDVLSERGTKQSLMLAKYYLSTKSTFDTVYTGTLDRQKETARIVINAYRAKGNDLADPEIRKGFDEYDTRRIIQSQLNEMLQEDPSLQDHLPTFYTSRRSFQLVFERAMTRWVSGLHLYEGVESWDRFRERVQDELKYLMQKHGPKSRVLVFASGGSISASIQYATELSGEETMNLCWRMVNTSITSFVYNADRISLKTFNGYPHLELYGDVEDITYR